MSTYNLNIFSVGLDYDNSTAKEDHGKIMETLSDVKTLIDTTRKNK